MIRLSDCNTRVVWVLGPLWALLAVGMMACEAPAPPLAEPNVGAQALRLGPDANTRLWSVSGSVSNSNPNAWVAVRNGNDVLYVYGSNNFTFPTPYVNNTAYNVTVAGTDPSLQCSITANTGFISNAPVNGVSVTCNPPAAGLFVNGFETYDRAPDWSNSVDNSWGGGGVDSVVGYCCGMAGPQAMLTSNESAHTGSGALVFSGWSTGNSNTQRAYLKTFDLSTLNLVGATYLSYWIFPQSRNSSFAGAVSGNQSVYSAVDLTLSDGTALHFRPGLFDQFGNHATPASQGNLILDTWNYVLVDLASVASEQLMFMSIGWQQATQMGGYRGYIDDVIVDYTPPPPAKGIATSWEPFQIQPTWTNTVSAGVGGGNIAHVGGLCCGALGPQAYVSNEMAHTGGSSLVYAGRGTGAAPSYAYMQVLDLSHSNIVLEGLSQLSYWIYPQSQTSFGSVSDPYSTSVAIDIAFSDGTSLRGSGLTDIYGNGVTPTAQSTGLVLDTWNLVSIPLGKLAGKVPVRIDVGWSLPAANGGYRGFIDDISIADVIPTPQGYAPSLVRIVLTPASSFMFVAGTQMVAMGIYSDGSQHALNSNVVYTSDNPTVASVDANGYVTQHTNGVAHISASSGSVISAPYAFTVSPPTYQLGGTISGVSVGKTVSLVQGRDHINLGNGNFTFPTPVASTYSYNVSLLAPTGERCAFVGNSNAGVMPSSNNLSVVVACAVNMPVTMVYNFNNTVQASYSFDATKIGMGNQAYLKPLYTSIGDSNAANFAAGTSTGLAWDGNGYMRLASSATTTPRTFIAGSEFTDPPLTWTSTVDPAFGSMNITGVCCGLTGPESKPSTEQYWAGLNSLLYSGNSTSATGAYAYTELYDVQNQNIVIDGNSYLSYLIYPQNSSADNDVSGNNSMYVAIDLVFTDGTDTKSATIYDTHGVLLNPNSQGAAGNFSMNTWNYVQASLGSLAGKKVARIDFVWQGTGLTGGFRGYIDDIMINAQSSQVQPNTAALDATWAPSSPNIIGYWNFDGSGQVANNTNFLSGFGQSLTLTAKNGNGSGMAYASGMLKQSIYLDGVDDYFTINKNSFPNASAMSFSAWMMDRYDQSEGCPTLFSFGQDGSHWNCFYYYCGGLPCPGLYRNAAGTQTYTPGYYLPVSVWHHVAGTVDATGLANVYIDGALYSSTTLGGSLTGTSGSLGYLGFNFTTNAYLRGFIDELAFWNVALSQNDIESIFLRQSAAVSGSFVSRVVSVPMQGAATTGLAWTSTLPFDKALPSNALSESTSAYPSLYSSSLNANLVGLWHLDEPALGTVAGGDFYDDSGHGNVAAAWQTNSGTLPVPNRVGVLNRSVSVTDSYNGIVSQLLMPGPMVYSSAIWFRKSKQASGNLISFGDTSTGLSNNWDRSLYLDYYGHVWAFVSNTTFSSSDSSTKTYIDARWHHAALTSGPSGSRLYVDGALVSSNSVNTSQSYNGYWRMGCDRLPGTYVNDWCLAGQLDEAAVWTRELSAAEISNLYRRGANRLKYQVKLCQTSNCSDAPTWLGPDATSRTYFSELYNQPDVSGLPGAAHLPFSVVSPGIVVNANTPYAQYRAIVESDDSNQLCNYGGKPSACSPEVSSTSFYRVNYDTSAPAVSNASTTAYYQTQNFAQSLGSTGCASTPGYALSPDGTHYYYYSGSSWVTSNGTIMQSNSAAQLTSTAMGAFSTQFSSGNLQFKAFLPSDGVQPCTLQSLSLGLVQ